MAIIKRKEKSLDIKSNKNLFEQFILALICIGAIPVYKYTGNLYISFAIVIITAALIMYLRKKRNIYKSGITGEKTVAGLLQRLDNYYIVYNDIVIGDKEKGAQIDHLVVSPFGIFCIETKNMRGTIIGKENDNNWLQKKNSKGGAVYEKNFYNPCKQSRGHINALNNLFRHSEIKGLFIKSVVVFNSDMRPELNVETDTTAVIKSDFLLRFISGYKEEIISSSIIKKIEKVLDKNIY